ncbi:MAG: hypothetical protein AB2A00_23465 [Myxococcota bacterium]
MRIPAHVQPPRVTPPVTRDVLPGVTSSVGDKASAPRTDAYQTVNTTSSTTAATGANPVTAKALSDIQSGRVWDLAPANASPEAGAFLQSVSARLDEYAAGKAGASVRALELQGKDAATLHAELLAAGFQHRREPLKGPMRPRQVGEQDGVPVYARTDGGRTTNPADPLIAMEQTYVRADGTRTTSPDDNVVPHDIYVHPADGGMVRIKPQGDPSSPMRPQPHASKAVLLRGSGVAGRFDVERDTGWNNEAFKVTNDGHPVPKAPQPHFGLRGTGGSHTQLARFKAPAADSSAAYADVIMGAAHTNLSPP